LPGFVAASHHCLLGSAKERDVSAQRKSVSSRTTKARAVPPDANASATNAAVTNAIEETAKRIRRLLDAHTKRDSAIFYKVGVQVRELDKSYGSGAIESLAASLGRDDSTLRSYARVASAWPNESEFKKLSSQRTADGKLPLCFTSFVVISSLEDPDDRQRMFERAILESLSSRDLKAAIADLSHDAGLGEDEIAAESATDGTAGTTKMLRGAPDDGPRDRLNDGHQRRAA